MENGGRKKKRGSDECGHAWSHTRTVSFQEDAFHPGCCVITHDEYEDVPKKGIWTDLIDVYTELFLLNVYLHAMHEREEET